MQVKRTGLAVGMQHPSWREDLAFKAVQISSDLQVRLLPQKGSGTPCAFMWLHVNCKPARA